MQQQQQQQAQMNQPNPQQPVTYMAAPQQFQHPPQSNRIIIIIVHVLVMVISILGMGFVFSLLGIASDFFPAAVAGPVFAVAFFWSLVELIVHNKGNWKAGIHPSARAVVCLVLWLSAFSIGAFLAVLVGGLCRKSSSLCPRLGDLKPMYVGSPVLTLLLAVAEFLLFVVACADTYALIRRRRSVAIASRHAVLGPPLPQGWYVAPGHQQQQQFVPAA